MRRSTDIIDWQFDAASALTRPLFYCPTEFEVLDIIDRFTTGSSSGTYQIVKAATAVAISAGTAIQAASADISTNATADTNRHPALVTTNARIVPAGSWIGVKFGGSVTSLVGLGITMILRQRKTMPGGQR